MSENIELFKEVKSRKIIEKVVYLFIYFLKENLN